VIKPPLPEIKAYIDWFAELYGESDRNMAAYTSLLYTRDTGLFYVMVSKTDGKTIRWPVCISITTDLKIIFATPSRATSLISKIPILHVDIGDPEVFDKTIYHMSQAYAKLSWI